MLEQARDALDFLGRADADQLKADRKTRAAVLNAVTTLGEASAAVSESFRARTPELDWRGIKAMRNILVHEYRSVDASILVEVVRSDLPPLIDVLERLLAETPE